MNMINLTSISTASLVLPQLYRDFQLIHQLLAKFFLSYIFFVASVGLVTNAVTVVLLSKSLITKNLKNRWTLIALALSDLLFNLALLIRGTHDTVLKRTGRSCSVISFLSHLAEVLSAWYTVSFTIQRFVAVHYPFQAAARDHSSRLISLLLVFLVSVSFCFSLTYYAQYVDCTEELTLDWFIADAVLSFVIPFALILVFNILINISIRKHLRSPISVHAILLRRRSPAKNIFQTLHRDETCSTENNTCTMANITLIHSEDTENIEMRFTNRELKASVELDCQARRVSIVSTSGQANGERTPRSPAARPFLSQQGNTSPSVRSVRRLSADSFSYRSGGKNSNQSGEHGSAASAATRISQSMRVTRILVLVSTCFLVLNAPAHSCVIAMKIYTESGIDHHAGYIPSDSFHPHQNLSNQTEPLLLLGANKLEDSVGVHIFYIAVVLTQMIAYASYSVNFFLYSFSGITFRTSLRQILRKFCKG